MGFLPDIILQMVFPLTCIFSIIFVIIGRFDNYYVRQRGEERIWENGERCMYVAQSSKMSYILVEIGHLASGRLSADCCQSFSFCLSMQVLHKKISTLKIFNITNQKSWAFLILDLCKSSTGGAFPLLLL